MSAPAAVAFDLGGTLTHRLAERLSTSLHLALEQELGRYQADIVHAKCRSIEHDYWTAHADIGGETLRHVVERALYEVGASVPGSSIGTSVETKVAHDFMKTPLVEGAWEWIRHLSGEFRLGLLSNFLLPAWSVRAWMEVHALDDLIRCVRVSSETGLRKPDPRAFLDLLQCLQVPAQRCVFVGNDPSEDVEGALRSGMIAVHISEAPNTQLERLGVAWMRDFADPPDIAKLLGQ